MEAISIILDRDSVCMADDCFSHKKTIDVNKKMKLKDFILYFLKLPVEKTYTEKGLIEKSIEVFPHISGGNATWILKIRKEYKDICNIAIIAQQWEEPKLLVDNVQIGELVADYNSNEFFMKYLCQTDPEEIYNELIIDHTR